MEINLKQETLITYLVIRAYLVSAPGLEPGTLCLKVNRYFL